MSVIELRSRQSVPSQAFQPGEELRVHGAVREAADAFARRRGESFLIQEFAGPFGRADFVLAFPRHPSLDARREAGLRPLRVMTEARLVSALSGRYARTVDDVAQRAGMTPTSALRTARELAGTGHVAILSDGRLRRHPALGPVMRTAAFEAKVKDWQSALRQARHYALWNSWSTVVLERARNRPDLMEQARRHGLGVVVAGRPLTAARVQTVPPYLRLMASESMLAATNMLSRPSGDK